MSLDAADDDVDEDVEEDARGVRDALSRVLVPDAPARIVDTARARRASRRRALTSSSSSRAPVGRLDSTSRVYKQCARGFHPIAARPTHSSRRVVIGQ